MTIADCRGPEQKVAEHLELGWSPAAVPYPAVTAANASIEEHRCGCRRMLATGYTGAAGR